MNHLTNQEITPSAITEYLFETIYEDMGAILVTKKLSNWYNLTYPEFCIELGKLKVNPDKVKNRNWEYFFNEQKTSYLNLTGSSDTLKTTFTKITEKELVFN